MNKDQHKDPLEALFQRQLDHPTDPPDPDGWDTPSENVWEGVAAALDKPSRKRFFWRYLLIAGLMALIALFGFLLDQNHRMRRQIETQNTRLGQLNQQIQILDSIFHKDRFENPGSLPVDRAAGTKTIVNQPVETPSENIKAGLQITGNEKLTEKFNISGSKVLLDVGKKNFISGTPDSEFTFELEGKNREPEIPGNIRDSVAVEAFSKTGKTDLPHKPIGLLFPLKDSIELLNLPDLAGLPKPVSNLAPPLPIDPAPAKIKFRIGPYWGASLTGSTIRYESNSSNTPFFRDWERADISSEYGVKWALDFGRHWSVFSGFSRFGIQQTSRQVFLIQYDHSREIATSDGELKSDYQLKAQSSLGESEFEIELRRRNGQPVPPNSTVRVAVGLRQKLDFRSIPLSVGYRWPAGPFELGLRGGGSVNFIGQRTLTATAQSQLQGIRTQSARVLRTFRTDRETVLDVLLGASISYAPAKNWQIYVEPTYRSNITPVAEGVQFNTRTYAWSFHMGAYFNF